MNTPFSHLILAISMITASSAMADGCTLATLDGEYTYWAQGADADGEIAAEVGQEHFDGTGNIATRTSVAGAAGIITETGTYTLNADCTGTTTYASGATYTIYADPNGDSFVFASSNDGVVSIGENTRVGE